MGFKNVKKQVITCLEAGAYDHEIRNNIDVKNLFQCGQLSDEYVIELIKQTRGNEYDVSPIIEPPRLMFTCSNHIKTGVLGT
ncbi:hypothetical protein PSSHI_21540 [Photobacterium sp. R1]